MKGIKNKFFCLLMSATFIFAVLGLVACDGGSGKVKSFVFTVEANPALSRDAVAVVNNSTNSIQVSVPLGTDVTALVATYEYSNVANPVVKVGNEVQLNGVSPNDFTNQVVYNISAGGGSESYSVAVYESSVWHGSLTAKTQAELAVLAGYTSITGTLLIVDSDVVNLAPLSELTSVGGYLSINRNLALENLDALSKLTFVKQHVTIDGNPLLQNLAGLANLEKTDAIYIRRNFALENLDGLLKITAVDHNIIINGTLSRNLDGLRNLKSVGQFLKIEKNSRLTDISGLSNLTSVGAYEEAFGSFHITGNASLKVIEGINDITLCKTLRISGNESLETVKGFGKVDYMNKLFVTENAKLVNIEELKALTTIREDLYINGNGLLWNLDFLKNLNSVGNRFAIFENPELPTGLAYGLRDQTRIGGEVKIHDNKN